MARVDDDVAEVVLGVMAEQERRIVLLSRDAERLVGRDVDAGVLRVVLAAGQLVDLGGVRAEVLLHLLEPLRAQLVAIAEEQRSLELPGVVDALEQVGGDKSLAGAGGQREQRPRRLVCLRSTRDLLKDGANRGILKVAPLTFATRISLEQRLGRRCVQ